MSDTEEDHVVVEAVPQARRGSTKRKKVTLTSLTNKMNKLK